MRSLSQRLQKLALGGSPSDSRTVEAARYAASTGGRHLRARTALAVYESLGKDPELFMKCAAGLECIHHASVILDDLPMMDNAPTRRGKPAVHIAYGPSIAILAALYLEARGRELIRECAEDHGLSPKVLYQALSAVDSVAKKLVIGQELDLRTDRSRKDLERMLEDKNSLFLLACQLPVIFLKKHRLLGKFSDIGATLSSGYQLVDDLRDLDLDESRTGKPVGVDEAKQSSLYIHGERELRARIEETRTSLRKSLSQVPHSATLDTLIEDIFVTT